MTDRELMQQALDALDAYSWEQVQVATNALRDRLAQPEQDCVGWFGYDTGVRAWFETNKGDDDSIPLYKAPRQWVGLTDDEIKEIIGPWGGTPIKGYTRKLFDQIETKLKEKNT